MWNGVLAINAFLESSLVETIVDSLILVIALVPALYLSSKFLFGDAAHARRLVGSPVVMGRLFFLCSFEIFLLLMKVPILLKIVAVVIGIIALPLILFGSH